MNALKIKTLVLTAAVAGAACEVDVTRPPVEPAPVDRVDVSAPVAVVPVGGTLQLSATPRAGDGTVLDDRTIAWSSSRPDRAAVTQAGLVTALEPGEVRIRATAEHKTGEVLLSIEAPPVVRVARVTISPASAFTLEVGQARRIEARAFAEDDSEIHGRAVEWTSHDVGVATIAADGLVRALGAGAAWIRAEIEGVSDSVRVEVAEPEVPEGVALLRRVNGSALPVVWQSFPITDSLGVTITRTIRIVRGSLELSDVGQEYRQWTTMERWEDAYIFVEGQPVVIGTQLKETRDFVDSGTYGPVFEGVEALIFRSETLAGHTFTGLRTAQGVTLSQRIHASGPQLELSFER